MEFFSDEALAIWVPIVVYWIYSGMYMMLESMDKYRLHSKKEEQAKNLIPKLQVVKGVLIEQLIQAATAFIVFKARENSGTTTSNDEHTSLIKLAWQFLVGIIVVDTWQYFWHRYLHHNKFLYRHIHSWHHRVVDTYCFASQYNHPLEALLLDTVGGALAFVISGMSARTSIFFFTFGIMRGIDIHCGLILQGDAFHWNNAAHHDVHHQLYGSKYNFSNSFFVTWDKLLGTHMPNKLAKSKENAPEAESVKSD